MFDAIEAINDIIDDINDDAMESAKAQYEEIYDTLCLRVECGDLTLEDAEAVNEAAYEKYFGESPITEDIDDYEVDEFLIECMNNVMYDTDLVTEGSNTEYRNIFTKGKKEIKRLVKTYKKQLKSGDLDGARQTVKTIENEINSIETNISNINSSMGSAVLADISSALIVIAETLATATVSLSICVLGSVVLITSAIFGALGGGLMKIVGEDEEGGTKLAIAGKMFKTGNTLDKNEVKIAAFAAFAVALVGITKRLKGIYASCKASKNITPDNFNTYKNKLLKEVRDMKKHTSKLSKGIDEAERKIAKKMAKKK